MPAIRIEIDGATRFCVNLDALQLFSSHIHSSLHEAEAARLEGGGGRYDGGDEEHRIWGHGTALSIGQIVKFSFVESNGPFDQGATLAELYPDEDPLKEYDFTVTESMIAELRARPRLRDGFAMQVSKDSTTHHTVRSNPTNDQFTFAIHWHDARPSTVRLSVRTYCYENVITRDGGTSHFDATLELGESATCLIG